MKHCAVNRLKFTELAREDYEHNKSYSLTLKFKKEDDIKKGVEND